MTKFSMCSRSFRSIDNQLAKLRRGIDTTAPPPPPEREGVEKYHLRERVSIADVFFFVFKSDRKWTFQTCKQKTKDVATKPAKGTGVFLLLYLFTVFATLQLGFSM